MVQAIYLFMQENHRMTRRWRLLWLPVLACCSRTFPGEGWQRGVESAPCEPDLIRLGVDEPGPDDLTPQEVAAEFLGARTAELVYAD
jgi:hypothetical protein